MEISYQVTKTLIDRILSEYCELDKALRLHSDESPHEIKGFVRERIGRVESIAAQAKMDGFVLMDRHKMMRMMKLELRSTQRSWKRHLVTEARLRRYKKSEYVSPDIAA